MKYKALIITSIPFILSGCFTTVATHEPSILRKKNNNHTITIIPVNLPQRHLAKEFNAFTVQVEPSTIRSLSITWERSYHKYGNSSSILMPIDEWTQEANLLTDMGKRHKYYVESFVVPRAFFEKSIRRPGSTRELLPLQDGQHEVLIEYVLNENEYTANFKFTLGKEVRHVPLPKFY